VKRYNIWDEVESLTGDMIYYSDHIEAVKTEREACAILADIMAKMLTEDNSPTKVAAQIAEAIRARK